MTRIAAGKRISQTLFLAVPVLCLFFLLVTSSPGHCQDASVPVAADLVRDGQAIDITTPKYAALFAELTTKYDFDQQELDSLFSHLTIHRRVLVLMDKQWEAKPYYKYWPLFINSSVIATGKKKLRKYKPIFDHIEEEIGVEREIVTAIWAIESRYGTHKGSFNVFRTLNTLFDAYPRRSEFFRQELIHFLLLCRENALDPKQVKGSYAGAFGQTQFISSSFRKYAVDYNQDGIKDVFHSTADVLASIANYLHSYGWRFGEPLYHDIGKKLHSELLTEAFETGRKGRVDWQEVEKAQELALPKPFNNAPLSIIGLERSPLFGGGREYVAGYPNFQVITEWNHSNRYAMAVCQLSEKLKH